MNIKALVMWLIPIFITILITACTALYHWGIMHEKMEFCLEDQIELKCSMKELEKKVSDRDKIIWILEEEINRLKQSQRMLESQNQSPY